MTRLEKVELVLILVIVYTIAAQIRFRWKHPELTETQIVMRTPEWFLWR